MEARYLIVNADDFGLTNGINRGIIEAHERGIVTSASLLVRYPAAEEAAASARSHPKLSVGLHLDLGEWRYQAGEWQRFYEVVDTADRAAVEAEVKDQLAACTRLLGRTPTHLDSHQHVHKREPVRSVMLATAERLGIPLRDCSNAIRYCGRFYGQTGEGQPYSAGISLAHLLGLIGELEAGWTEIGCHPGYCDGLDSVYSAEREDELRVLCAEGLRAKLKQDGVGLGSFRDLAQKH